jgi:hypothetical protein
VTGWFKNTFGDDPTTVFPVHPDFVAMMPPDSDGQKERLGQY